MAVKASFFNPIQGNMSLRAENLQKVCGEVIYTISTLAAAVLPTIADIATLGTLPSFVDTK